jgi:hypothetical protein
MKSKDVISYINNLTDCEIDYNQFIKDYGEEVKNSEVEGIIARYYKVYGSAYEREVRNEQMKRLISC